MKTYLLFVGSCYYPSGGCDDFVGDFETVAEAEEHVPIAAAGKDLTTPIWYHVFDLAERRIVARDPSSAQTQVEWELEKAAELSISAFTTTSLD